MLKLSNTIGKRYGTHCSTSTEHYKGESHVKLSDADPESRKPWKTTNMVGAPHSTAQCDLLSLLSALM
jgi:hypothetical protein